MRRTNRPYKRKNIKKQDLFLDILEEDNSLFVKIEIYNLSDYKFPDNAKIFLEAYNKLDIDHIDLGEIKSFSQWRKKRLPSFEVPQRRKIQFRVKVVDTKTWHLLGLAENLKERRYADSLLSIQTDNKINTVFKVLWDDPDNPVLIINQNLRESLTDIKPLLAETVFREILCGLLLQKEGPDEDDLEDHKWIQFAKKYKPKIGLMELDIEEKKEWINNVVNEFSKKLKTVKKLKTKLGKD